jgi:hypothetical protein
MGLRGWKTADGGLKAAPEDRKRKRPLKSGLISERN